MSGIKKLFKKKQKPVHEIEESPNSGYIAMDSSSLSSLPAADLMNIIYRFNSEVQILNKQLDEKSSQVEGLTSQISKLNDEINLHKDYSEKLNQELRASISDFNDVSMALHNKSTELGLAKEQLESKDELLESFKNQISVLKDQHVEETEDGGEVKRLKKKIKKSKIHEQRVQELTITNKMLENDVHKHELLSENLNEQIRLLTNKLEDLEKQNKDLELSLHKLSLIHI